MDELKKDRITRCVLIALDGSEPSMRALDYAVGLTGLIPGLRFVMLSILPQLPPIYVSEAGRDGKMREKLKVLDEANRRRGAEVLKKAKGILLSKGIPEEHVETRLKPRAFGLAKDILNEAESGHFDAVVIGRRGLSRTQETFMGSASNQVIQHSTNVPVWIVDGKVDNPRILLAVDGSEASLRVVDHVAFMLGDNPQAELDLLHVAPKFQSFCAVDLTNADENWEAGGEIGSIEEDFQSKDEECLSDFHKKALAILRKAGISRDRITIQTREIYLGVARTVIKAAKDGGYGTIVVGRRGLGRSAFLGSVSDRIIRQASDVAVWVVN